MILFRTGKELGRGMLMAEMIFDLPGGRQAYVISEVPFGADNISESGLQKR
jgi:hypothetical protein